MSVSSVNRSQSPKLPFDRAFTQNEYFSDTGGIETCPINSRTVGRVDNVREAAKCPYTSPFHFKSVARPFPKERTRTVGAQE
jgi:hypothetical protein